MTPDEIAAGLESRLAGYAMALRTARDQLEAAMRRLGPAPLTVLREQLTDQRWPLFSAALAMLSVEGRLDLLDLGPGQRLWSLRMAGDSFYREPAPEPVPASAPERPPEPVMVRRCAGMADRGRRPCRLLPEPGSDYCQHHAPKPAEPGPGG